MKNLKCFFLNLIFLFFFHSYSGAEVINNIEFKGNRQIQSETLLNKIKFIKGKDYDDNELNLLQKRIFDTGFFQNVKFKTSNSTLIVYLQENPIIDFFYIYGDKNKDRIDKLYEILQLKIGSLFSDYKLLDDISKITQIYKYSGYYDVIVEPSVKKIDQHKVNISIKITKNEKYKINRIFFIGNKNFKSSTLSNVVSSTEDSWWKFMSTSSFLNEERINFDKNNLKSFYLNEGFYDIQIISSKVDILDNHLANIIFSIDSGVIYSFDSVNFGKLNFFDKKDRIYLQSLVKKIEKDTYSRKKVFDLKDSINEFLISNKLQNLDFNIEEFKKIGKVDLKINFYEKKLPTVQKILVNGNSITEEKVIRNNLTFSEGDSLTNFKIIKSEDNLNSIGIFKKVKISQQKISDELADVIIDVEEQPTGSIMGGVGIGSNEAAISFSITEKNLAGTNITVNSELSIGTEKVLGNFLIKNPDFNDSGISLTNNFFAQNTDYSSVGYESSMFGDDISSGYQIYRDINLRYGAGFDYDKISTSSAASAIYQSQKGNYLTYKTFYGLSNDKRNRKFNTTKGHLIGFDQTFALPGSDIPYVQNNIYGKYYQPLSKDYIFNFKSGISSINTYNGDNVKLSNRLFLSSKQLKGFESRRIGPIDGTDHVGGNYSYYAGISSTFPNPLPEKWNATTVVFLDSGNVFGVDYDDSKNSDKLRSALGFSLDWLSPLGPISFTLSSPISKSDTDKDQTFSFQIGSTF